MSKPTYNQWKDGEYAFPGGFEMKLFEAFENADYGNRSLLKKAFPSYFGVDEVLATGTAYSKGDRSVGLGGQVYTFEIHRELLNTVESREWYRKEFQKLFREVADEEVKVFFDDEDDTATLILEKQVKANKIAVYEIELFKKACHDVNYPLN